MKVKKTKGSKALYLILSAIFGTVLFVAPFKLFIENNYSGFQLFGLTVLTMYVGSFVGSLIARIITRFYEITANVKFVLKNLLVVLLYSGLIVAGLISWIFEKYPLFDLLGADVIKSLFLLKLIVNLVADNLSQSIVTGGK